MRRVFVIGNLPAWTTAPDLEAAVRHRLEAREDVRGAYRVFVARGRLNVTNIPDAVAADTREWFSDCEKAGRLLR
jgi:hypothetical protein